jgi:hypothetical protein
MILKIFSPKNSAKKLAFLTQNKAKLYKILIITLVFEKKRHFLAENWKKSPKNVIITSTPDEFVKKIAKNCATSINRINIEVSNAQEAKLGRIWSPCPSDQRQRVNATSTVATNGDLDPGVAAVCRGRFKKTGV